MMRLSVVAEHTSGHCGIERLSATLLLLGCSCRMGTISNAPRAGVHVVLEAKDGRDRGRQ